MSDGWTVCPKGKWTALWNAPVPLSELWIGLEGGPSPSPVQWQAFGLTFPYEAGTVEAIPLNYISFAVVFPLSPWVHVDLMPVRMNLSLKLTASYP
jgi:hypothetical protein